MKTTEFISILALTLGATATAGNIHGTVTDADGPLPEADVVLYRRSDTTKAFVTEYTDMDGKFDIANVPPGQYVLKVEFLGFKPKKMGITLTQAKPNIKNMTVRMQDDTHMLSEVVITGERTALHVDPDKKTFLVNANAVTEGVSISDMLREIPTVDVDVEGNVSLRSNESVEIYIDGKPSGMSDDSQADILEQLPAGSIEKVEIITNPSSKYNAEGEAGIINIVLKESFRKGYYGTVNGGVNVPIDGRPGGTVGVSLNYNTGKWSFSGSLGAQRNDENGKRKRDRLVYRDGGDTSFTHTHAKTRNQRTSEFLRLGAAVRIDTCNYLSWNALGSLAQRKRNEDNLYTYGTLNSGQRLTQRYATSDYETSGDRYMLNTSLSYNHKSRRRAGEEYTIAATVAGNGGDNENTYDNSSLDTLRQTLPGSRNRQDEKRKQSMVNYLLQIDYTLPLSNVTKMEMGAKADLKHDKNKSDSIYVSEGSPDFEKRHLEPRTETNNFEMQQNIYSAYASLTGSIMKQLKYNIGLRGELTDMSWKQHTTGDKSSKDPYFDLFPSAFFSYAITKSDELQLNYTRRLQRPRMFRINPYVNHTDSSNVRYGNPDLDPEKTHSIELNYVKTVEGDVYTASLYMKYTSDVVSRYSFLDGGVLNSTFANMSKSQSEGLELIAKNHIGILTLTSNLNLYHYKIDGGNFTVNYVSRETGRIMPAKVSLDENSSLSLTAKMTADLQLPWGLTGQVSGNYRSPVASSQGRRHHNFSMNAGLRRAFFNKKVNASLSVRDIFNTNKFRNNTFSDTFDQEEEFQRSGTTLYLNLSYNFGNMSSGKKKAGKGAAGSDEGSFDDMEEIGGE